MAAEDVEEIMGQFYVALGQGSGSVRIPRAAIREFRSRYSPRITPEMLAHWDLIGVQVLERVRAIGRLAAYRAHESGQTAIKPQDLLEAMIKVEESSQTAYCPVALGVEP